MKKIILFISLLIGIKINAQIVGGYIPLNSTKTPTMGGLKVAGNETVTGTFSVGNTATITGALKASSTMSLGSANLTGGNTGTVAVLSDAVFPVQCMMSSSNPADAISYTLGSIPFAGAASFNVGKVYMPYNATLVGWTFSSFINGTPGSAESASLGININGTTTQLSSAIITSVAVVEYSASGLSTNVNAGQYINAVWTCPTWATNPTSQAIGIVFWFVRRT